MPSLMENQKAKENQASTKKVKWKSAALHARAVEGTLAFEKFAST